MHETCAKHFAIQNLLWSLFLICYELIPQYHQLHVNRIILLFDSFQLETHCFYMYRLWLQGHLGSLCFRCLWIIPKMHTEKLERLQACIAKHHLFYSVCMCGFFCLSLGCISPRSLSLLGRGTGAPQSGIHNLWAAGPCQGAAATQHVSTPQGAVSSAHLQPGFLIPPHTCPFCVLLTALICTRDASRISEPASWLR